MELNILSGKTAHLYVSEHVMLKIKVLDEKVLYQFIGQDDGTADPIFEAPIQYEVDPIGDDDKPCPCFYTNLGSLYFLKEFIED